MSTPIKEQALKTEEYFLNVGPQHPSTHGVLHLLMRMEGENIVDVEPQLGYIHRSIEKMSESQTYWQLNTLASRMDYLSAHIYNQACALAVEKALGVEIPDKAKAIRILMAELTRLSSHQLWWGVMGMDLGAFTPFFHGWCDRESIVEIFEKNCGNRLTMNYIVPGGVTDDVHPDFVKDVKEYIEFFKGRLEEYEELLTNNRIFIERSQGVGVITKEDVIGYGCSGPLARASGVSCDVRKRHPYDGYDQLEFEEPIEYEGDCLARYKVRIREMWQSISIIEQLIDNIPEGDHKAKMKKVLKVPKGEYYQRVETARGELGVFLVGDGTNKPYRLKYRTPNFSNLGAFPKASRGEKMADISANLAAFDFVIPDIDR